MSSGKLNFKKILNRLILFVALGVGAHVAFVLSTTERSLLNYLGELSVLHLLTILVLIICPWLGYALRIRMWSAFLNEKISYGDAVRVVITADVASALSPTSVGGAPVKAALLLNRGYASGSVGFMLTYGVIEDIIFYTTGIVLAGSAVEKPDMGEVIAVGNGKILDNGERRALDVKVGDKVIFGKYAGQAVKVEGEEVLVMREEDIMGVMA